jgi:hypothetical protein
MMGDGWLSALQVPAELRYGSTEERRKLKWSVDEWEEKSRRRRKLSCSASEHLLIYPNIEHGLSLHHPRPYPSFHS